MILNKKNIKSSIWLLAIGSIIISYIGYNENAGLFFFSYLIISAISMLINPIIPLCLRISIDPFTPEISSQYGLIMYAIPILSYYIRYKKINIDNIRNFLVIACLLFVSFTLGYKPIINTMIVHYIIIVLYIHMSSLEEDDCKLLLTSLIISGLMMIAIVSLQIFRGTAFIAQGYRLTYKGELRTFANSLSIPFIIFLYRTMSTAKSRMLNLSLTVLFSIYLILSFSRGNILAVIVVSITLILFWQNGGKNRLKKYLFMIMFIFGGMLLLNMIGSDNSQNLTNIASGEARIDIWTYYFKRLFDGGFVRIVFGFGPGDLRRVSLGTFYGIFYAHSTLFDYIFSYGLCGLLIEGFFFYRAIKNARLQNSPLIFALLFLTAFLFFPFGTCDNLIFHTLLGLTTSYTNANTNE